MHVMFIHPNFPAQFGHIAHHLATQMPGWQATCVTSIDTSHLQLPFVHINYKLDPNAPQPKVFYNPKGQQGLMDHLAAVYRGLRAVPQIKPDLVVGHMSYGTMLYLKNIYDCPFVGYFELLPPPFWSKEFAIRPDFPPPEHVRLANATYHSLTYLHLFAVQAMYTPTHYQKTTAPPEFQDKISVIFDGVDTQLYQPRAVARPTTFRGVRIGPETKVLTYVSRGLESIRGFDLFMKMAKRVLAERSDAIVLIAGEDRTAYGHEQHTIGDKLTFKQWVLAQDEYDLSRIHFLGRIPATELATLYNLSDLHTYLTAPYVLSWSCVLAMSSGCALLGSDTAPVREVVADGKTGRLADMYDIDALTKQALWILDNPADAAPLRQAARELVMERYEKTKCIRQLVQVFEQAANQRRAA